MRSTVVAALALERVVEQTYPVRYRITPEVLLEASRRHASTLLARYRVVMGLIAGVGIVVAAVVDLSFRLTLVLFGILMALLTWMQTVLEQAEMLSQHWAAA
jgi:hypothetical protein